MGKPPTSSPARAVALVALVALAGIVAAVVAVRWWHHAHPRDPTAWLDDPIALPETLPVLPFADRTVVLPGAMYPYQLRRPETQAVFIDAEKQSGLIGIATDTPADGGIACAVRVLETHREGANVRVVVQGVARVRLVAPRASGEWSIRLVADSPQAKERARAAAEQMRAAALRAIGSRPALPETLEQLKSTIDPTHLVDLATTMLGLPREVQVAVLATEDLSERVRIAQRAIEVFADPTKGGQ